MNNLFASHQIQRTGINSSGVTTLYFFDIWEWKVSPEVFDKLVQSDKVLIVDSFPFQGSEYKVADHCTFLFKKNSPVLDIPSSGRMRISMAALVKIVYQDRIVFLVEKKTVKPFGGAYWFTELPSIPSIKLDNPATNDLRFTIDVKDLELTRDWFASGNGRELSPERELYEELCLENEILDKSDLT